MGGLISYKQNLMGFFFFSFLKTKQNKGVPNPGERNWGFFSPINEYEINPKNLIPLPKAPLSLLAPNGSPFHPKLLKFTY